MCNINKDENVHKFALSARRGELLESEREKKERDIFGILYMGYLLSIVKIKRERKREERERKRRGMREEKEKKERGKR